MTCDHDHHWYPSTNEDGWRCVACDHRPGEPPGYAPHLDRELLDRKVGGLLLDLHEAKIVYVSNGSMGESVEALVSRRCRQHGLFDQYTIARYILDAFAPSHAEYWRRISDGVVSGADMRERCRCGALATGSCGSERYCREHGPEGPF